MPKSPTTVELDPKDYRALSFIQEERVDRLIEAGYARLDVGRVRLTGKGRAVLGEYIVARLRHPTAHGLRGCIRHPDGDTAA